MATCNAGRAVHQLLNPGCKKDCACCPNFVYFCRPICCNDTLSYNIDKPDASECFCDAFTSLMPVDCNATDINSVFAMFTVGTNVSRIPGFECVPLEHCEVEIAFTATGSVAATASIFVKDRIVTEQGSFDVQVDDQFTIHVNGELCYQCGPVIL